MDTRFLICAVAAAAAMTGCASMAPGRGPGPMAACNESVCHVVVHVTDCNVWTEPDRIPIGGHGIEIHWDLDNASTGYTFAENGVFIKPNNGPTGEFTNPRRTEQDRKFILNDRNSKPYTYPYGIQLMHGSTACPVYDPWIINQG